jgi:hypothetical protein
LLQRILGATPIAGNRRGEQQQCRSMPAIQDLDLSRVLTCSSHFAISNVKTIGADGFVYAGEVFFAWDTNCGRALERRASAG